MGYGWGVGTSDSLRHMIPQGTPLVLMPFMTVVELISLCIRPITLAVRLVANIVAGHCLLGIVGGGVDLRAGGVIMVFGQTMLFGLELAVAFIQRYVFVVLLVLYSKEVGCVCMGRGVGE